MEPNFRLLASRLLLSAVWCVDIAWIPALQQYVASSFFLVDLVSYFVSDVSCTPKLLFAHGEILLVPLLVSFFMLASFLTLQSARSAQKINLQIC